MKRAATIYATSFYREEAPNLVNLEGGFYLTPGKTKASGYLEGQAVIVGQIIAQLMNQKYLTFGDRVDYANIMMSIVDHLDTTGEARRALSLATREVKV